MPIDMERIDRSRTRCLQVHVDAARWPDDMLQHFTKDGGAATPDQVRTYLRGLKDEGYECLPCSSHKCDDKGNCTGEPLDTPVPQD